MKIIIPKTGLLFICIVLLLGHASYLYAKEVKIGIRAIHSSDSALKRWQPTADYLNQKIPEHTFVLIPYEINSLLNQAASRKEFDFVLTNPAAHIEQNLRYGATPIATLINKRKDKGYTRFGSVIFTRADRTDINSFHDLVGKSFMGADEQGFGGWRIAWYELLENGINPYTDFQRLSFGGGIQYNVVKAVRGGQVDAGTVRTNMLEQLAHNGKIQLKEFKIIGAKISDDFNFMHSTRLYPEWPFAKLEHTPQELASKVAAALYSITPDSNAALQGEYLGWTFPLDYEPVANLLKTLRVGPFKPVAPMTWLEVFHSYWQYVVMYVFLFLTVSFALGYVVFSNKRLKQAQTFLKAEITQHKKTDTELTSSKRMLQTVLDTIPVRVFWKDINSVYLGCNKLFARDAGLYSPENIIGKTDFDMGWSEQAQLYRNDDKTVMNSRQPKLNYEEPQTTPDGNKIWLETSKIPLTDNEDRVIGMLGTYSNITERKQNQEELEDYKKHLEDKVKERTAALAASNKELESYSYSIAHDLRAPLRSLVGFSQIVAEDAQHKLNKEELDALERIITAGKRMAELIDDILDLSRITRRELNVTPVDISKITQEIIDNLDIETQKRSINWHVQKNMQDCADESLVRILFQNLIDNACKFTQHTKNPTIDISASINGGSSIYHVRDNGIGFDMKFAGKIFMPFRRLHNDEYDGTGIGLATVERIVQRHGGKIWAEGNPQQGATFHFTFNEHFQHGNHGP